MKTTVVICSVNRPMILHETVLGLMKQTARPESILLSLCDESSVLSETKALPGVRCILGPKGLTSQRNAAIPHVPTPYTLFLDDDVELASDYVEQMEQVFADDPAISAALGTVVVDGARGGQGIERDFAIQAVRLSIGMRACPVAKINDFYGCNMFVRSGVLRAEKFDERLPLYGWLEDRDFLWRCMKHGKIVRNQSALLAHLGTRTGRTSDVKYGYSKIANPWYLWKKSVIPSLPEVVLRYWLKTTFANTVRAVFQRPPRSADYRKRLAGNLMAYRDLLLSRLDPLNILNIHDPAAGQEKTQRAEAWRSVPTRSASRVDPSEKTSVASQ